MQHELGGENEVERGQGEKLAQDGAKKSLPAYTECQNVHSWIPVC